MYEMECPALYRVFTVFVGVSVDTKALTGRRDGQLSEAPLKRPRKLAALKRELRSHRLWELPIGLKSPPLSKERVLLPRNDDLFVVREHEGNARTVKKTGLLDVHQVDDAIACRTEEGGLI